jgi:integrase
MTIRERGQFLLDRHPFQGFTFPKERNTARPIVTADELKALETAASSLGRPIELFFTLVKETGHRCSAVSCLRWCDVDLESGQVTFRGEHDKLRRGHTVPLSKPAIAALTTANQERKAGRRIGDGWLFPSLDDETHHVKRLVLCEWWRTLERRSGIERVRGRGWHSLRRFFATDLQHSTPLKVICELGGWRDHNTILRCYTQAVTDSMREALERRSLRAAGE